MSVKPTKPKAQDKAPKHLSDAAAAWWRTVHDRFELDPHQSIMVGHAAEALDAGERARQTLEAQGQTFLDRFNAPRARPELRIQRQAAELFARICKQLDIDTPSPDQRRPRGLN